MTKITKKVSEDGKCSFFVKKHTYKVGKQKLTSVTSVLKEYFSGFDAADIAQKMVYMAKARARKENREVGEEGKVTYWKKKWKEAAEHGSRTHALIENFVLANPELFEGNEERDIKKYIQAKHWLVRYLDSKRDYKKTPEFILYNKKRGIAGQIDLLLRDTKSKKFHIVDYKTNEKISQSGYKGQKAKEPISDLEDCSLSKYSLQLSLYAYLLEEQGYEVGDLIILHLAEDKVKEFPVDYTVFKPIVAKLLKHYESNVAV